MLWRRTPPARDPAGCFGRDAEPKNALTDRPGTNCARSGEERIAISSDRYSARQAPCAA